MGVATTTLIAGGIMAATSATQAISAAKAKKKKEQELNSLEVPEVTNAFKDMQISTVGSDLIREESSRTNASLVEAARYGGSNALLKLMPKIVGLNNEANAKAQKYLDDQVIGKEYAVAKDNVREQGVEESRYMGEVQGLGQAIQTHRQDIWSGVRGFGSSLAYMGRNLEDSDEGSDDSASNNGGR